MTVRRTAGRSPIRRPRWIALLAVIGLSLLAGSLSRSADSVPIARESKPSVSPEEALVRLKKGNLRFRSGAVQPPGIDAARVHEAVDQGQAPFATILGCSDSSVPCEIIFGQGIGDLFVVRVVGNVCGVDQAGSIEYGVSHLGTPLLVVLGHEKCGAVASVVTGVELDGLIPELGKKIYPAVERAQQYHPGMKPDELVPFALRTNVLQSIEDLFQRSGVTRARVREGKLTVVGAIYDIDDGAVTWLGPHPRQASLVKEGDSGKGRAARGSSEGAVRRAAEF
jgi:carbonic anhydrase